MTTYGIWFLSSSHNLSLTWLCILSTQSFILMKSRFHKTKSRAISSCQTDYIIYSFKTLSSRKDSFYKPNELRLQIKYWMMIVKSIKCWTLKYWKMFNNIIITSDLVGTELNLKVIFVYFLMIRSCGFCYFVSDELIDLSSWSLLCLIFYVVFCLNWKFNCFSLNTTVCY